MPANRYQLTHTEVSAIEWTGGNLNEVMSFCGADAHCDAEIEIDGGPQIVVFTYRKGEMIANTGINKGDWIVKGANGELRVFDPITFQDLYHLM